MANVLVQESSLTAIANAIRGKNGTQTTYKPAQMAAAITAISTGIPGLLTTHAYDVSTGFVNGTNWYIGGATVSRSDVYEVESGESYLLCLGDTIGSRFRALFTTEDTSVAEEQLSGINIVNSTTPSAYQSVVYTAPDDGYISITKDNENTTGLKTYVYHLQDLIDNS